MITAVIVMTGLAACNHSTNQEAKQDAASLTQYVDSVDNLPHVYTVANWSAIDDGYQQEPCL